MIRAKTCFVAEGITTDRETNQVSAFGLLENLQAASYPMSVPKLCFFCLWERTLADPARCGAEFSITLNDKEIVRQSVDANFEQYLHNRCTIRLEGFELNAPGSLVFRLAIPGHGTAEWTMEASVVASTVPTPNLVAPAASRYIYESGPVSMSIGKVEVRGR